MEKELQRGLRHVEATDLDEVYRSAKRGGWVLFKLDGKRVADKAAFFDCVRSCLPMDPPLEGNSSWDALSDSLWGGLDALEVRKILIVWTDARIMMTKSRSEYGIAEDILKDLPESLGRLEDTYNNIKTVCIVIVP
ncbi:MAG: barstar family protein [Candidatus Hydrogenedentes bacterium]|nr:barstar family protein [Candidatus Hydrogenedentota bacterium]